MEVLKIIGYIVLTYMLLALSFIIGTEVADWMRSNEL